jgi:long-subunit fatty acid transport protein
MRRVWLVVLGSVVLASPAAAQSNVEVNVGLQLDFQSPGARSLGMGSAFIGMADDATAAFVNPAGLRALSRKEVSFEFRGHNFSIPVTTTGRFGGPPRLDSAGRTQGIDTITGLVVEDQDQSASGLSFLSFVYPRSRWAISAYRHEVANFDTSVQTQGPFFTNPDNSQTRRFPIQGQMDLEIVTYGVAGSVNFSSQFSVGAGLGFYDYQMDSRVNRFNINNPTYSSPVFYGAPNFTRDNIINSQIQEGEDWQVGVNVGALWSPSSRVQVGAVYRQGPDFDLRVANLSPTTGAPFEPRSRFDRTTEFHTPHVFGVGGVVRPFRNSTVAIDVARVLYSRLTDDFVDIFADPPNAYTIPDGTEVHLGFEYVITGRVPLALRTGYWFDPEHSLDFVESAAATDTTSRFIYVPGEDEHHVTFGAGVVFGRFEINGAGDFSDRTNKGSISAVVRF